jgi:hypothetical protein
LAGYFYRLGLLVLAIDILGSAPSELLRTCEPTVTYHVHLVVKMQEDQRRLRMFFISTRLAFGWRNPEAYDGDDGSAVNWYLDAV